MRKIIKSTTSGQYYVKDTEYGFTVYDSYGNPVHECDSSDEADAWIRDKECKVDSSSKIQASNSVESIMTQLIRSGVDMNQISRALIVQLGDGRYGVVTSDVGSAGVAMSISDDQASVFGIPSIVSAIIDSWDEGSID